MKRIHENANRLRRISLLLHRIPEHVRVKSLLHCLGIRRPPQGIEASSLECLKWEVASSWETVYGGPVPGRAFRRKLLWAPGELSSCLQAIGKTDDIDEIERLLTLVIWYFERGFAAGGEQQLTLFGSEGNKEAAKKRPDTNSAPSIVGDLAELVASGHTFSTIYADPPWPYSNQATRGAAARHYPTMSIEDICAEPVPSLVGKDAHLHLWTTNAFFEEAQKVIRAWGFRYKSCLVWVKPELGLGNYWRVSHEFLLLGVRGNLGFRNRSVRSWLQAPRTTHSRKPGIVRMLIEKVSPGPYLELYGREEIPHSDWTVYGNDVTRRLC